MSSLYQYTEIQQEVEDTIDDILGEEISSLQKNELADSISFLINGYLDEHYKSINSNTPLVYSYPNASDFNPFINFYLLPRAQNAYPPPSFNNIQQNSFPLAPLNYLQQNSFPLAPFNYLQQNSFSSMMTPSPYTLQMYQQFQPFTFNQLPILNLKPVTKKKSKKKSRSRSKSTKSKQTPKHTKTESTKSKSDTKNDQNSSKSKSTQKDIKTFSYEPSSPFNGILKYLTDQNGPNLVDSNIVSIKSTCPIRLGNPIKNVLVDNSKDFVGLITSSTTVTITFNLNLVKITNYSIRRGQIGSQIQNWVFEISENGENWTEVDNRNDVSFDSKEIETFSVNQTNNRFVSFCRFNKIGLSSNDSKKSNEFSIQSIEFFGRLKKRNSPIQELKRI